MPAFSAAWRAAIQHPAHLQQHPFHIGIKTVEPQVGRFHGFAVVDQAWFKGSQVDHLLLKALGFSRQVIPEFQKIGGLHGAVESR